MANTAKHGTAGSTATTVTLDRYFSRVQVVNRGTSDIFFTTDGVTVPTVGGDDTYVVAKGSSVIVTNNGPVFEPVYYGSDIEVAQQQTPAKTVVKVIASASSDYSVQAAV